MFRQLILSGALGVSLFLSACGGGGGGSATPTTLQPSPTNSVSGSATKGIIINGKVDAYAIRNNAVDQSSVIASTTTGSDGTYSLNISNYNGPASIEITAQAGTTMLCDVPFGCQTTEGGAIIAFGQPASLAGSNFKLRAFIPRVDKAISASITPLTHMAAQYAESQLASGNAATTIDTANSRVANLFKLDGDLLALTPPDITKANNNASKQENQYAVLAAAFANVAQSIDKLGETIEKAANNFSNHDGQLTMVDRDNSLGEVTLSSITGAALAITTSASADGKLNSAVISSSEELYFLNSLAISASEDSSSTASSSATSGADELAKTKALIGDIRALASAGQNYLSLSGKASLSSFEQKLGAAEPILRNSEGILHAAKKAGLIAAEFSKSIQVSSPDKSSLLADIFNASSELQTTLPGTAIAAGSRISYSSSTRTLILDATIDSVELDLSVDVFHADTGKGFPVTLSGKAQDANSRVTIESLEIKPTLYVTKTVNTTGVAQVGDINVNDIYSLALGFKGHVATRKPGTGVDGTVFAGAINITYVTSNHRLQLDDQIRSLYVLQSAYMGGLLQAEQEQLIAELSFINSNAAQAIPTTEDGEIIIGQFADPFATGSLLFTSEINIAALGKTKLEVQASRTGLETAAARISFENTVNNTGRKINFSTTGNFNSDQVTGISISNQDNVQLSVEQLSPVTASLKLNGTQYATISQVGSGLIKVTYSDGTFESFN